MRRPRSFRLPVALVLAGHLLAACTSSAEPSTADEPADAASHAAHASGASASAPGSVAADASASAEGTPEEVEVRIEGDFERAELTVAAGSTVIFVNDDTYPHTVTEGSGGRAAEDPVVDSEVAAEDTVRVTFDDAGTYELTCRFHPSMQMTITVEG